MDARLRFAAVVPLVLLGTYLTSLGLAALWKEHTGTAPGLMACAVIAASLRGVWMPQPAAAAPFVEIMGWVLTVKFTRDGLASAGFDEAALVYSAVLEIVNFAVAREGVRTPWATRFAAWRQSMDRIAAELRATEGFIPWGWGCVRQALHGRAERPGASVFDAFVADVVHAEEHLHRHVATLVLPAVVEETILTAGRVVSARAIEAAADSAAEAERCALREAAACRDVIAALTDVAAAERDRMAHACESWLLAVANRESIPARGERARNLSVAKGAA